MAANKCSKWFLRIVNIILMILFIGIIVAGAIVLVNMKGFSFIAIGIIAFGVIGFIISICGLIGASYDPNEKGKYSCCLVVFFIAVILLCIIFVILGIACLCIKPTINWFLTQNKENIIKFLKSLTDEDYKNLDEIVEKMINSLTAIGIVCIVMGGIILFVLIVTSCHMGRQLFSKFFIGAGSFVMLIVGALITAISAYVMSGGNIGIDFSGYKSMLIVLLVFGIALLLWGVIGLISGCCGHSSRCILFIYVIGVIILVLAFLIIGIIGIAIQTSIFENLDKMCEEPSNAKTCQEMLKALQDNLCDMVEDETEKAKCKANIDYKTLARYTKDMIGGWLNIIVSVAFIVFIFLFFVMISSCMACKRNKPKPAPEENVSAPMPEYHERTQVAF
ncbi:uncharacterized protein MONOS_787 [Monocercomonoides exilis]|uniref:uncharacterized protein n=1 Tax=Monocercomonoides exilis TaxID=2049356 RepID=UPI0035596CED|nr:hypothetical protein MONOS_787 [Monocercomonoides exilis]|eukprot:MONOS_787.1-p1 / transcript=MONOS_787.1 / gene=MONOS_787 / organism=Monocercomonoides_exilis_PA203 / gene_product=unspecified product / transcript_product=unspecified product / location=Mono_scaffold00013:129520-130823(-) / protein_length=390 / sequence_SO=supercontig / SO=protein_coding / is_pseudo=false